jgi:signal transduction histidine kinase
MTLSKTAAVLKAAAPRGIAHGRLALTLALPDVGSLYVDGDDTRLVQVLTNLVTNAVKYTPRGGKLMVTAVRAGSYAIITVQDTGRGIPADRRERIFDLFERGPHEQGGRNAGLGIGLTLARRVVELHGGTLNATSAGLDRGSAFIIRLPVTTTPPPSATVRDEPAARPRHAAHVIKPADYEALARVLAAL